MRLLAAWILAVAVLAGCGGTSQVREPDVIVSSSPEQPASNEEPAFGDEDRASTVRIAVVTHGQASSAFWTIVRNGVEAARRQTQAEVTYHSPDVYSVASMRRLINTAVDSKPDGLVVSIPSDELEAPIRRAVAADIPVVSINSGSDLSRRLGTLAHIGQPELTAGFKAGQRLVAAGARHALCVNQEVGNEGLDLRCEGFARALRGAGGSARVVAIDTIDVDETRRRMTELGARTDIDSMLTLNNTGGEIAAEVVPSRIMLGTFDYSPGVLAAIRGGRIRFAVDQQPYLQGFLPVVLLAERIRYGLFPAQGEVIPTGPNFVTSKNAAQAEALSRRGIR